MSGLVNKVKEALHSDKSHETTEGTAGPHSSKVANAADPRVDSDRDHRANPATGTNVGGYQDPASTHVPGNTSTTGHSDHVTGFDDPTGTHGPHGSRVANAADPRIDSDRDHRAAGGPTIGTGTGTGTGTGIGSTGHHAGATGTGYGSSNVTGYNDPTGTHGPHGSRVANAADPRVDSDRDHRGAHAGVGGIGSTGPHTGPTSHTAAGTTGTGYGSSHAATGYNDPTGTHGTHGSRVANAADPRVDSDRDHRGAPGSAGTLHQGSGPGPAAHTAGPHESDALNKVDPRVDSDLDGSRTVGGNKTFQQ